MRLGESDGVDNILGYACTRSGLGRLANALNIIVECGSTREFETMLTGLNQPITSFYDGACERSSRAEPVQSALVPEEKYVTEVSCRRMEKSDEP